MNQKIPVLHYREAGFTIIELMVAVTIGLFLMMGVVTIYVNGVRSTKTVDDQTVLVDNARFALETLSADLNQAGVYGRVLSKKDANGVYTINNTTAAGSVGSECYAGWALDTETPVMVTNDALPAGDACTTNYLGGDVLEVRGSLRDAVADGDLRDDKFYLNSDVNNAQFFYGATSPAISADAKNYQYYVYTYYIAADSDNAVDNIPSLHRVALINGGVADDQVLLSGVSDLQVQLGLDTNDDAAVDSYVDADAVANWGQVKSVQLTLTLVSLGNQYAGTNTTDGRREITVTSVTALRNINL